MEVMTWGIHAAPRADLCGRPFSISPGRPTPEAVESSSLIWSVRDLLLSCDRQARAAFW